MNFCVFILTHGRPDSVLTYNTLRRCGYTGPIRLLIDNEDATANVYHEHYPDEVIVFDKAEIAKTFDEADNTGDRRSIVYARNAVFDVAEEMGLETFAQFDDDYSDFSHRLDADGQGTSLGTRNLDSVFDLFINFLRDTPQLNTIAFSQGGDHIGGIVRNRCRRKVMSSFFCRPDRRFQFLGRINEDVNYYTLEGSRGALNLSVMRFMLGQKQTQSNTGGMTDIYKANGTFVKSFYSVIMMPSAVKIAALHDNNGSIGGRIHHRVSWNNCVPKILREPNTSKEHHAST